MPRDPRRKLPLRGLLKLHHLRALFDGIRQLSHLTVRPILYRIVYEHEADILRQVLKNPAVLLSWPLGNLEKVHIVHTYERPLGHHRHGLHRVQKRLRRDTCRIKAVDVKLGGRAV